MKHLTANHKKDIETILHSGQFDPDFYLKNYPDVKTSGLDPLVHYVLFGSDESRNPNETFNTELYRTLFTKIIPKAENSFAHYLRHHTHTLFFEKGLLQNYSHKMLTQCLKKLENYIFFDPDYYKKIHQNINFNTISSARHALLHGIGEGRDLLSPLRIAHYFGAQCLKNPVYKLHPLLHTPDQPQTIGIFYHSKGNSFIHELALILKTYFQNSGFTARLLSEETPLHEEPDLCVFCAPHEFFFLEGSAHWKQEDILRRSIMFNTEQPHTLWFTRGLIYCLMAAGIMDLCYQNIEAFKQICPHVFHFDPLPDMQKTRLTLKDKEHPFFKILPASVKKQSTRLKKFSERAIDISFFGNVSQKREKFFTQNARFFSRYDCFLYYRKTDGPLTTEPRYDSLCRLPRYLSENSKIFLNIHRDDTNFFEWHRIVLQGMVSGAVVVTEECFPHPLYKAGKHYLSESTRHIPNLIEWLLNTQEGQKASEDMRSNCLTLLKNRRLQNSKAQDLSEYISSIWAEIQ